MQPRQSTWGTALPVFSLGPSSSAVSLLGMMNPLGQVTRGQHELFLSAWAVPPEDASKSL